MISNLKGQKILIMPLLFFLLVLLCAIRSLVLGKRFKNSYEKPIAFESVGKRRIKKVKKEK